MIEKNSLAAFQSEWADLHNANPQPLEGESIQDFEAWTDALTQRYETLEAIILSWFPKTQHEAALMLEVVAASDDLDGCRLDAIRKVQVFLLPERAAVIHDREREEFRLHG